MSSHAFKDTAIIEQELFRTVPNTPEENRAAVEAILSKAQHALEAAQMIAMLGLTDTVREMAEEAEDG